MEGSSGSASRSIAPVVETLKILPASGTRRVRVFPARASPTPPHLPTSFYFPNPIDRPLSQFTSRSTQPEKIDLIYRPRILSPSRSLRVRGKRTAEFTNTSFITMQQAATGTESVIRAFCYPDTRNSPR